MRYQISVLFKCLFIVHIQNILFTLPFEWIYHIVVIFHTIFLLIVLIFPFQFLIFKLRPHLLLPLFVLNLRVGTTDQITDFLLIIFILLCFLVSIVDC